MSPRKALSLDQRKSYSKKETSLFAIRIQARRLKLGIKQNDLAAHIGTKHGVISRYEAGVFPNHPDRIIALAKALNCSLDYLFGLSEEP